MKGARPLLAAGLVSLTTVFAARSAVTFEPRHTVRAPAASLSPALRDELLQAIDEVKPKSVDDLVRVSLEQTGKRLHFGLSHTTRLSFDRGEREGNCIEYAHLFSSVLELGARRAGLEARARVVHSEKARVLGLAVPLRGFGDHDWVLIEASDRRLMIDPTFDDAGLGADISGNVVAPPR